MLAAPSQAEYIQRVFLSAKLAYFPKSSSSPPQGKGVAVPARAAHSHCSSEGSAARTLQLVESHAQKASARSRETRTTGWRRWLPTCPGVTWSKPHWSCARESCAGSKAWYCALSTSISESQKGRAIRTTRETSSG